MHVHAAGQLPGPAGHLRVPQSRGGRTQGPLRHQGGELLGQMCALMIQFGCTVCVCGGGAWICLMMSVVVF